MNKPIVWRVLRFNNMQIRFFILEGNPFFDASDIFAIVAAGISPLELKKEINSLPESWWITLTDNGNEIVAISPAGALKTVLASTAPDIGFFEWLLHAQALISKGVGRLAVSEGDDRSVLEHLQLLRRELEREIEAVGMTLGEIRRMVLEHSCEGAAARVLIAEAIKRKIQVRGAAFTAVSVLSAANVPEQ